MMSIHSVKLLPRQCAKLDPGTVKWIITKFHLSSNMEMGNGIFLSAFGNLPFNTIVDYN